MKIAFAVAALLAATATPALAAPIMYTLSGNLTGNRAGVGNFTAPVTFTGTGDTANATNNNFVFGNYVNVPLTSLSAVIGGDTYRIQTPAAFVSFGNNVGFMFDGQLGNAFSGFLPMGQSYTGLASLLSTAVLPSFASADFTTDRGRVTISALNGRANLLAQVNVAGVALPEPATWGMMILGFAAVGSVLRGRRSTMRTTVRLG